MRRSLRWWCGVLVLFSLTFFRWNGCEGSDEDAYLQAFESCDELEGYIEDMAIDEYTWSPSDTPPIPLPLMIFFGCASADIGDDDDGAMAAADGERDFSTTNLQEVNVDESDFVKNDGDYLYVINGYDLAIIDAWPVDDMTEIARMPIAGYPVSMFLMDDKLAVLSYVEGATESNTSAGLAGDVTKVTMLDITDRTAPLVEREVFVEGRYYDSRRVEERLYLITTRDLADTEFRGSSLKTKDLKDGVKARSLADWMPKRKVHRVTDGVDTTVTDESQVCGCENVLRSNRDNGLVMTSVLAVDLSDPDSEVTGTSAITGLGEVYASVDSLYLAVSEPTYGPWAARAADQGTRIHKFDLEGGPEHPIYQASGKVPGTPVNSFAMDEAEGTFRIATSRVETESRNSQQWINGLYVMRDEDGILEVVGEVPDLAPGEDIRSVRFFDDIVYVVTFHREINMDPLFPIDLSDPENPTVLAELEITGYSTYMHPFGEDHLLSIGEEIDPDSGMVTGMAVSLFDVADPTNPSMAERVVIPTGWNSLDALYDHHAFTYFAARDLLAVPVIASDDSWGETIDFSGVAVFHVTVEDGIRQIGMLDAEPLMGHGFDPYYDGWCNQVRRSVVIEDVLYGIGAGGVLAAHYRHPDDVIASVLFPDHGTCDEPWDGWNDEDQWGWD
jgi:hypothetical protein